MREASYSYVLYLVSIGEDIAYLQTPSKTTWRAASEVRRRRLRGPLTQFRAELRQ